jgi:hypothetical protein
MAKKRKKKSGPKRITAALSRYLKKLNPAKMKGVTHVRVKKLRGGGVSITPVVRNPGKAFDIQYKGPDGWKHAGTVYATSAREAMRLFDKSFYRGFKLRARGRR